MKSTASLSGSRRLCLLPFATGLLSAAQPASEPLAPPSKSAAADAPLFTRLGAEQSGLAHVNRMNVDHPMSYLYHSGMTCGGVAVADFDGDGKPDIFFSGGPNANHLYRQDGDLHFADITASAHPDLAMPDAWGAGATAADVNGDGRTDLYVNYYMRPNQLFINLGPGKNGEPVTFRECAKEAGLDVVDCSHTSAFADYDGDGRLDLYVLTNRIEDPDGGPAEMPIVKDTLSADALPTVLPGKERMYAAWRFGEKIWGVGAIGTDDILFHQTGVNADGVPVFEDRTRQAGIQGRGDGLSVTWWDPDADGDPDIYVANDFLGEDAWYENNGDGTFTNVIRERVPHTPWFSMGSDIGDANGDGQLDLLVADMSATSHFKSKTTMGVMGGQQLQRSFYGDPPQLMRNALYLSTGTDHYAEAAYSFKVSSTDWTWAVKFADYDLDGWQDLYFTNGISRHMNDSDVKLTEDDLVGKHMFEFFKTGEMRREVNRAYHNAHGHKFEEVSADWGLDHLGVSYGSALADLDGDGDPDLVTVNLEEPDSIYRNDSPNPNRIALRLKGKGGNVEGLNATVRITTPEGSQIRHLSPTTGYFSCNEPTLLFGLGDASKVSKLEVHWPFGGVQVFDDLEPGRRYDIEQDASLPKAGDPEPEPTRFGALESFPVIATKDGGWEDDFTRERQSLLPWAFSQLGPALASADVDGDGDSDFFVGGSAGELAQLRIHAGDGKFTGKWVSAFAKDKDCEDAGAVFLDVDNDGDADLFVAGGSNDFPVGDERNRDRLYLNDGKGNFSAAPAGALPADTRIGSTVSAADFDRDGDLDLFVGTRLKAWSYPLGEPSRLLLNESSDKGPRFVEAPEGMLARNGPPAMVTASLAIDLDRDGWVDLVTASEWGPVRWFRNEEGKLVDQSDKAGLAPLTGFWNSLAAADFDHDGDLDLVAGNLGLNSKYKQPGPDRPHLAYYGDFDGNGAQFVEVKREADCLYPERGRSCSSRAMPFISEKFGSFRSFALASLEDIYSKDKLEEAVPLSIVEFQTGVFFNEGGHFSFRALPREAQLSPGFGLSAGDFTGDGHADLIVSGNFKRGPQIETGPFDGSLGVLLEGDGEGGFAPREAGESGIVLNDDFRSIIRIDLDDDGCPDVLAAANNGPLRALRNQNHDGNRWLAVRLPDSVASAGASVSLEVDGRPAQTEVVSFGAGYWSQDDSVAWFGLGSSRDTHPGAVVVRWADGSTSRHPWDGKELSMKVSKP